MLGFLGILMGLMYEHIQKKIEELDLLIGFLGTSLTRKTFCYVLLS